MIDAKPARIRLGMVGGGKDAFIGAVHSIAALLQQCIQLLDRERRLDMLPSPVGRYVDL